MSETTFKPGEAARIAGIGRSTVSAWTAPGSLYYPYFTPGAQGITGGPRAGERVLSERDVQILCYVRARRAAGALEGPIADELEHMRLAGWDGLPPIVGSPAAVKSVTVIPEETAHEQQRALLREIVALQGRLDAAQARLDARDERLLALERALARAELELELWRAGRLRPDG